MGGWRDADRPMVDEVSEALERNDVEGMRQLLTANPQVLTLDDGTDFWLCLAAGRGNLEVVKMLVESGLSVNIRSDVKLPEGPINDASSEGRLEVVRWLLDQGATINHTVRGQVRCLPLTRAARDGHFDVVKLLVERGADIHASWRGINAMMEAQEYRKLEIAEYLRGLGVKDIREMQPPDYATSREQLLQSMVETCGPLQEKAWSIVGEPAVRVHLIPANDKFADHTLFTIGLSDHRLPNSNDPFAATEFKIFLPREWPVSAEAFADAPWKWTLQWLKKAVVSLREATKMPEPPLLFINEAQPEEPLGPNTRQCAFLCHRAPEGSRQMPDNRWIGYHLLFSIYPEEVKLIQTQGLEEFIKRLQANDIALRIDLTRPNMGLQ